MKQSIWDSLPTKVKNEQIELFIKHGQLEHKINKLEARTCGHFFFVLNTESSKLIFFDSSQDSLNYCLDYYKQSFKSEQQNIFTNETT